MTPPPAETDTGDTGTADTGPPDKDARAQDIALALLGAGGLPGDALAENAVWDRPDGALSGRARIRKALNSLPHPHRVEISQVATQGKSGSVSGRYWPRPDEARLFCHIIRYTTAASHQIAQLVSYEHRVTGRLGEG